MNETPPENRASAPASPTAQDLQSPGQRRLRARVRAQQRPVDIWQRHYRWALIAVDLVIILGSAFLAMQIRFGDASQSVSGWSYAVLSVLLVPVWFGSLLMARAYEMRFMGTGADEFKRITSASLNLLAVLAVAAYTLKFEIARGYVAIALPIGTALLLLGRYGQRRWLHARRRRGRYLHRVVAVGGVEGIRDLADQIRHNRYVGLELVGACVAAPNHPSDIAGVPVLGSPTEVLSAVATSSADTVAVAAGPGFTPSGLRRLSWQLEGTGVALVAAPALLDVAGPRIKVRPVAGLPLLHVEEPELAGARQVVKSSFEWTLASIAFVFVIPLLIALAIVTRLDSKGAALFRQTRVGRHGEEFTVYKLRTMHVDAESLLDSLLSENEASDGLLFKIRADPRVTRVGRVLRKFSLDELPQLWNVVRGDMALIGPRPPLPGEVARYGPEVARRLLVRPGITGLWQVSGRSNLSWDDSVRLDLYYVENWSLSLDAMILWKTMFAILGRDGAY
ncbi:MAG TPA: sugar transferase [Mycobacteriales bacterium]|nr:sugar transferase [Mycobacteriales bacterium]